jgi:AcrR family transcriptional regulator
MSLAESKSKQTYHHGNVKEALIQAAITLLQDEPVQNLSLRRLAKEVGITPTAVYNHFSDKDALVAAIKMESFENFNQFLKQHCTEIDDPEKIFLELGVGYYRFSKQYPSQFDVLFNYAIPPESNTEELIETACQSQELLKNVIQAILIKRGKDYNEDILIKASLMAWTQIHGLVTLTASGSIAASARCQEWPEQFAMIQDKDVEQMIADHVSVLIHGMTQCQCFQSNNAKSPVASRQSPE